MKENHISHHIRLDPSGMHGHRSDPTPGQVQAERTGQHVERGLGRAIGVDAAAYENGLMFIYTSLPSNYRIGTYFCIVGLLI